MSEHDDTSFDMASDAPSDTPFDAALRRHLQHSAAEPDDDGFSLRVMAALPAPAAQRRRRWARWLRHAQWAAITLAACGAAGLLSSGDAPLDAPHAAAAVALMGLLIFWSIPSRWSRG